MKEGNSIFSSNNILSFDKYYRVPTTYQALDTPGGQCGDSPHGMLYGTFRVIYAHSDVLENLFHTWTL